MYKTVKPTTFTLSLELLEDLDIMSKELGKKKTAIISEALEMYMDYQDIQLAKQRLNDSSGTISHDELLKELGIQMYSVVYKKTAIKDFKRIDKVNIKFITDSILEFTNNFSFQYEQELLKTGKIKKLQGVTEELYRLKLRTYRVIYKKEEDRLIILVVAVKSRENSYKK